MLSFVLIGLVLLFFLYVKFVKSPSYFNQIPLVRPWFPLMGNVHLFYGKSSPELFDLVHSWFEKYDRLFQVWFGVKPVICVCHPDLVRRVLTSGACLDKPFFYGFSRIDQGLWAAKASLWRSQRKALNVTFAPSVLNNFIPTFENCSKLLVQNISQSAGNSVSLLRHTITCAFYMVSHTTMGIEKSDKADIDHFLTNLDKLSEIVGRRFLAVHLQPEPVYRMTAMYQREMELRRECNDFAMKILEEKINNNNSKNGARKVFIEQLLDGSTIGRTFTSTEIIQNVYTLLAAGSETSALTIAQACLLLAMFPDIQEKLFSEISTLCPDSDQPLTATILSDLVYMDAFLKEVLRLYPVAPFIARQSSEGMDLDGTVFPKGTIFVINFRNLHRREEIWGPDGECFDPERFLKDENIEHRHPFGYLPFSGGQRSCIGQRYAVMSMKVALVHLLRSFRISTKMRFDDLRFKFGLLLELSSEYPCSI